MNDSIHKINSNKLTLLYQAENVLKLLSLLLLFLLILLVSCSTKPSESDNQNEIMPVEQNDQANSIENATATPLPISTVTLNPTPIESPTLPPVDETPLSGLEAMIAESRNKLLETTWVLSGFESVDSGSEIPEEEFQTYSLKFHEDGTFAFTANCNSGVRDYYLPDPYSISLNTLPLAVPPNQTSTPLHNYLEALAHIEDVRFEENDQTLILRGLRGTITFSRSNNSAALGTFIADGSDIDLEQIQLDTQGIYESWTAYLVPESNFMISDDMTAGGLPEHIEITFDGTDPLFRTSADPVIYIIPITAYRELWESNNNVCISTALSDIWKTIRGSIFDVSTGSLILPFEEANGFLDLIAETELTQPNGFRFIGRFAQEPQPISNDGLRYFYQGFSDDGRFLIAFFAPISHPELPYLADVPSGEFQMMEQNYTFYMEQNMTLPAFGWLPDVNRGDLDELIKSLSFDGVDGLDSPVVDHTWQWQSTIDKDSVEITVNDPTKYSLHLNDNGTYEFVADCNGGSGTYELIAGFVGNITGSLVLTPDPNTLNQNDCGTDSLSPYFLDIFSTQLHADYFMEEGNMVLYVLYSGDDPTLRFQREE